MPRVDDVEKGLELSCFSMDTVRWHTRPSMGAQTIGHHTSRCLWICWALVEKPREELLFAILSHDAAEWTTGDIPGQTKSGLSHNCKEELVNLEFAVLKDMGINPVPLEDWESWMVAFCDAMEGLMYSKEALAKGNTFAKEPARNYLLRVKALTDDWQPGWPEDVWERVSHMLSSRMPKTFGSKE